MGIFSKPEVIILKESNAAKDHLDKLESLLPKANKDVKDAIQKEIAVTKAGIAGEDNIMFELKHSNMDMVVLHDINLETKSGLKAQIDFIVVTSKVIFLIECKNLVGNIDIDSKGAFIRTVTYGTKKQKEGIYSPITQGERHLSVLKEAKLDNAGLVTSLAIKRNFDSSYKSLVVLANPKTIVNDRYAPKEIKSQVIRADQLVSNMKNIIAASNDFASTKKEMMSIAQGILDMNIESRKDYGSIIFLMGLAPNVLGYRHPAAILDRSKNKCCGLITDGEELKNNQLCFSVDTTVLHLFSDLSRTCPRTSGGWNPPLALTPKNNRSVSFLVA